MSWHKQNEDSGMHNAEEFTPTPLSEILGGDEPVMFDGIDEHIPLDLLQATANEEITEQEALQQLAERKRLRETENETPDADVVGENSHADPKQLSNDLAIDHSMLGRINEPDMPPHVNFSIHGMSEHDEAGRYRASVPDDGIFYAQNFDPKVAVENNSTASILGNPDTDRLMQENLHKWTRGSKEGFGGAFPNGTVKQFDVKDKTVLNPDGSRTQYTIMRDSSQADGASGLGHTHPEEDINFNKDRSEAKRNDEDPVLGSPFPWEVVPGPGDWAVLKRNGVPNYIHHRGRLLAVEKFQGQWRARTLQGHIWPQENVLIQEWVNEQQRTGR